MKYTVLIDYVVALLREIRKFRPTSYASLGLILKKIFDFETSFGETQELAKYLETRGWAKVIYPLGDIRIQITTAGLVYIESKGEDFFRELEAFKSENLSGKKQEDIIIPLFEENNDPKQNIYSLLTKVSGIISEKRVSPDYLTDIEVIKLELSKTAPDFRLIDIKLNTLSTIGYISSEVQELKDYLSTTPIY